MALIKALTPSRLFTFNFVALNLDTVAMQIPQLATPPWAPTGLDVLQATCGAKNSIFFTYSWTLVTPGWNFGMAVQGVVPQKTEVARRHRGQEEGSKPCPGSPLFQCRGNGASGSATSVKGTRPSHTGSRGLVQPMENWM